MSLKSTFVSFFHVLALSASLSAGADGFGPAECENGLRDASSAEIRFTPRAEVDSFILDQKNFANFLRRNHHFAIPRPGPRHSGEKHLAYHNQSIRNQTILVSFRVLYPDNGGKPTFLVTSFSLLSDQEARVYWRAVAAYLGFEGTYFIYPDGQYLELTDGDTSGIFISGPVLAKLIIKHGLSEEEIEAILSATRKATLIENGDYQGFTTWNGYTFRSYFTLSQNEIRLKTLYRVGPKD
ncbi:MAG: hypothetical protein HC902_15040 [Calothrix sp. SM1_5_4]|nr:hypothetical protein [Calothrix sp. SM1_5_4]